MSGISSFRHAAMPHEISNLIKFHQSRNERHFVSVFHFSLRLIDSNAAEVANSGDVYDISIAGGRIGVAAFNQSDVIWSNLVARCQSRENLALYFDGVSDYAAMGNISQYGIDER